MTRDFSWVHLSHSTAQAGEPLNIYSVFSDQGEQRLLWLLLSGTLSVSGMLGDSTAPRVRLSIGLMGHSWDSCFWIQCHHPDRVHVWSGFCIHGLGKSFVDLGCEVVHRTVWLSERSVQKWELRSCPLHPHGSHNCCLGGLQSACVKLSDFQLLFPDVIYLSKPHYH